MVIVCPCPKHLPEPKLKSFGLITLTGEMSRQLCIDCVEWLLIVTLRKIHREKEQFTQRQIGHVQIEEKRNTKKKNVAKFAVQLKKKKLDGNYNKGSGNLRARLYPTKFSIYEKELK